MRFLMLVCSDDEPGADPGADELNGEQWAALHQQSGEWVTGDVLQPHNQTIVVRTRDGRVLVTGGGSAITSASILGFDVLECADADQAVRVVSRHEMARRGRIELRPLMVWDD